MSASAPLLLGCGILRREVRLVCERNGWNLERRWLHAGLHGCPARLGRSLGRALDAHAGRDVVLVYGCCHPAMDALTDRPGVRRVDELNCLTLLLGWDEYAREVQAGAYFLLEDWMTDWMGDLARAFGTNDMALVGEILRADRSHLLALDTPCSGDWREAAERAARAAGMPLRWRHCELDHLEHVLAGMLGARPAGAAS